MKPSRPTPSQKAARTEADASSVVGDTTPSQTVRVDPAHSFLSSPKQPDEIGRLGPYRVLAQLGAGGMGLVFKAEDPALRRIVALKVMLPQAASNPEAKARFLREARAQAKVEHENIIPIYLVGEERGVPFISMPLLKGQTLAAALRQSARPPLGEVLRIGREMAEGLAAAHEHGLVHRDIKPPNVWLEGNKRRVKILDFGLARADSDTDLSADHEPVTRDGAVLGTPAYMSPEQGRGEAVDARTDLFSLGVVLYQMAAGELPFRGATTMAILTALAVDTPAEPILKNPELPQPLNDLIMRLLAKRPVDRPASASEIAEEIVRIEQSLAYAAVVHVTPREDDPWTEIAAEDEDAREIVPLVTTLPARSSGEPAASPFGRRKTLIFSAAGLLAVLGLAVGAWLSLRPPKPKVLAPVEPAQAQAAIGSPVKPKPEPPKKDAHRVVAEWVLNSKSPWKRVELTGDFFEGPVEKLEELPREGAFQVVSLMTSIDDFMANQEGFKGINPMPKLWLGGPFDDAKVETLIARIEGKGSAQVDIRIEGIGLTDRTLTALAKLPAIQALDIYNFSNATSGAVAKLKALPALWFLRLHGPGITDDVLPGLVEFSALRNLYLDHTPVTAEGVKKLAAALPMCTIVWNGGTIEPTKKP